MGEFRHTAYVIWALLLAILANEGCISDPGWALRNLGHRALFYTPRGQVFDLTGEHFESGVVWALTANIENLQNEICDIRRFSLEITIETPRSSNKPEYYIDSIAVSIDTSPTFMQSTYLKVRKGGRKLEAQLSFTTDMLDLCGNTRMEWTEFQEGTGIVTMDLSNLVRIEGVPIDLGVFHGRPE